MNHSREIKQNNFGLIKFTMAILVILSHSFSLLGKTEPLYGLGSSYSLGTYAVFIFLIISGYSIGSSWVKSNNLLLFFIKRVKRIFPALIFLYVVKLLLISPIFSDVNFSSFINNPMTKNYALNILFFVVPFQNTLPGLFDNKIVNGSLWTLPYEFSLYFLIPTLYFLFGKFWKKSFVVLSLILIAVQLSSKFSLDSIEFLQLNLGKLLTFGIFFCVGVFFQQTPLVRIKKLLLIPILILNYLTFGQSINLLFVLLSVWMLIDLFGFIKIKYSSSLNHLGDYSYGIYIWSWFIQQIVIEILGTRTSVFDLFILSSTLSVQMGIISWNLIESKFSKSFYKNFL